MGGREGEWEGGREGGREYNGMKKKLTTYCDTQISYTHGGRKDRRKEGRKRKERGKGEKGREEERERRERRESQLLLTWGSPLFLARVDTFDGSACSMRPYSSQCSWEEGAHHREHTITIHYLTPWGPH